MYQIAQHASAVWAAIAFAGFLVLAIIDLAPFRSVVRKRAASISAVVVFGVALWLATPATPAPSAVNGTYRNACCRPIMLKDGTFTATGLSQPFKLRLQKFGLEAQTNRGLEVRNGQVVLSASPEIGRFLFSDDVRAFTLCSQKCGTGHEFEFRRD
jgi:hypothetical protein